MRLATPPPRPCLTLSFSVPVPELDDEEGTKEYNEEMSSKGRAYYGHERLLYTYDFFHLIMTAAFLITSSSIPVSVSSLSNSYDFNFLNTYCPHTHIIVNTDDRLQDNLEERAMLIKSESILVSYIKIFFLLDRSVQERIQERIERAEV